jgi:hypothetical protein
MTANEILLRRINSWENEQDFWDALFEVVSLKQSLYLEREGKSKEVLDFLVLKFFLWKESFYSEVQGLDWDKRETLSSVARAWVREEEGVGEVEVVLTGKN